MAASHLIAFFVIATLCHGALASDRPATSRLTDFYLSLAIGGALGGVFNTLVAPVLFDRVIEYPLVLACGILLLTFRDGVQPLLGRWRWWIHPTLVAVMTIVALTWPAGDGRRLAMVTWGFLLGAVLVSFSISRERRRFGICVLLMLGLYGVIGGRGHGDVAYASRTFFGTYRVMAEDDPRAYTLLHGTTVHGRQHIGSPEPLTYYYRNSPIGQLLESRSGKRDQSVGAVGLGTGTLAWYARSDQRWTFYEIDPEVERIARDRRYFTHLATCGATCQVIIGDARLTLQQRSDMHDVIVLDAFSSDAIPIHLLTREAVEVYLSRLEPDGVLAIHISNNHLNLQSVVARVMRELGLVGRVQLQQETRQEKGEFASHWAVLARSETALGTVVADKRWATLRADDGRAWTDDFSNIWSVIYWRR